VSVLYHQGCHIESQLESEHRMKLGLSTGYWSSGPPAGIEDAIAEAERLGFDSMWAAEAYGSDALTPLAWWGAKTSRIKLGTSISPAIVHRPSAERRAGYAESGIGETSRFAVNIRIETGSARR